MRPGRGLAGCTSSRAVLCISICLALGGCGSGSSSTVSGDLGRLQAVRGAQPAIVDAQGRQVILRGVNFNHLGDYFSAAPSLPTVGELTDEDWDDAAALGMNVIRLVTNWSAWEPERNQIDLGYLARVRAAVDEANARGMYVVIDMHQDAWSKFVFTPADEICPEGTRHQVGWDGAPLWATFTDGAPTCTPDRRENSPAVIRAWDSFYENRDGIADELAELWGFIAEAFAGDDGVAGYDLLNEPGNGSNVIASSRGLGAFYGKAIDEIRRGEARVGDVRRIIFFEPGVTVTPLAFGFSDDPQLVFAPHNYFASIIPGDLDTLNLGFGVFDLASDAFESALWFGEYGSFSSSAERNDAWYTRVAELEDARGGLAGGTWWQWEQECGDPHDTERVYPLTPEVLAEREQRCGSPRFRVSACVDRAYARAAPGRLTSLSAPGCGGVLQAIGASDTGGVAELWIPSTASREPRVSGQGVGRARARAVRGGYIVQVDVDAGAYRIEVDP